MLAILHLSDIHITGPSDLVFSRTAKMVACVAPRLGGVSRLIIVATGDIAFSGKQTEYNAALDFFAALQSQFEKAGHKTDLALCPGNHDCDFDQVAANDYRSFVIQQIRKDIRLRIEPKEKEAVLAPQAAFNAFASAAAPASEHGSLRNKHRFGDSNHVIVHCINTAWCSALKEKQGELVFPVGELDGTDEAELVVSLFHHPYNWLENSNARTFKEIIESSSDIVFTGHEHVSDSEQVVGSGGGSRGLYIEGGVLQSSRPDESTFNLVLVNTTKRAYIHNTFTWVDGHYSTPDTEQWTALLGRRTAGLGATRFTPENEKRLIDLGASIQHPRKGKLSADDIFVYPDLSEEGADPKPSIIAGEHLVDRIVRDKHVVILGSEKSGKTMLSKRLALDLKKSGFVPVLLNGADLNLRGDARDIEWLKRQFEKQYESPSPEELLQLPKQFKVAIIDNAQLLSGRLGFAQTVQSLETVFDGIVMFSLAAMQGISRILEPNAQWSKFATLRIMQFGNLRRAELAERWLTLESETVDSDPRLELRINKIKRDLDTVVGNNYIPALPIFLISIIQSVDSEQRTGANIGTYGYYYELLIKQTIAKNRDIPEYDITIAYLSRIAGWMRAHACRELTEQEFRAIHAKYEAHSQMNLDYPSLVKGLVESGVLESESGMFRFKYDYLFYFFAANNISERLSSGESSDEAKQEITKLVDALQEDESSNIFLFIAHLTRHPLIIESILKKSSTYFSEVESVDVRYDPKDGSVDPANIEFHDISAREQRLATMRRMDEVQSLERDQQKDVEEAMKEARSIYQLFSSSQMVLQILGQFLKNFPGSLSGETKKKIIHACHGLGMRSLSWLQGQLSDNREEIVLGIIQVLRELNADISDEMLQRKAAATLNDLRFATSYQAVRRIAAAVSAPQNERLNDLVAQESKTDAAKLVAISSKIDQSMSNFPLVETEKLFADLRANPLGKQILKTIVASRLYVFPEPLPVKQRICQKLDIAFRSKGSRSPVNNKK